MIYKRKLYICFYGILIYPPMYLSSSVIENDLGCRAMSFCMLIFTNVLWWIHFLLNRSLNMCIVCLFVIFTQLSILGSVSIETSLATSFQLRQFNDVIVNKVNTNDVTLDMLELVFKDHFVTRSDCWRLHQSLIGSCVYYCNKVTFVNMRVHVNEMWMKGDKVACGVVGDSTKVFTCLLFLKVTDYTTNLFYICASLSIKK